MDQHPKPQQPREVVVRQDAGGWISGPCLGTPEAQALEAEHAALTRIADGRPAWHITVRFRACDEVGVVEVSLDPPCEPLTARHGLSTALIVKQSGDALPHGFQALAVAVQPPLFFGVHVKPDETDDHLPSHPVE